MKKIQVDSGESFIIELGNKGQRIMTVKIREWGNYVNSDLVKVNEIDTELTEELVKDLGFKFKGEANWTGNGADYQPEHYPRTWQRDYIKNGFILRFEDFQWEEKGELKCETSIILFYILGSWYPKITEGAISVEVKSLHELRKVYELYTKLNL